MNVVSENVELLNQARRLVGDLTPSQEEARERVKSLKASGVTDVIFRIVSDKYEEGDKEDLALLFKEIMSQQIRESLMALPTESVLELGKVLGECFQHEVTLETGTFSFWDRLKMDISSSLRMEDAIHHAYVQDEREHQAVLGVVQGVHLDTIHLSMMDRMGE